MFWPFKLKEASIASLNNEKQIFIFNHEDAENEYAMELYEEVKEYFRQYFSNHSRIVHILTVKMQ